MSHKRSDEKPFVAFNVGQEYFSHNLIIHVDDILKQVNRYTCYNNNNNNRIYNAPFSKGYRAAGIYCKMSGTKFELWELMWWYIQGAVAQYAAEWSYKDH